MSRAECRPVFGAGLTVSRKYVAGLGVVDDVRFQSGYLLHTLFILLDGRGHLLKFRSRRGGPRR